METVTHPPRFQPHRLRMARQLKGWTPSDLARQAGVTRERIRQLEMGGHLPSISLLERLGTVLSIDWRQLFTEDPS